MKKPNSKRLQYGAWGIVLGAVLTMIIGFTWGGWMTQGRAKENSDSMLLASRATICAAQFAEAPNHEQEVQALKKAESWNRADVIAKGGWDKMPGQKQATSGVAQACVDEIPLPASQ